jgi:hypothetical protein
MTRTTKPDGTDGREIGDVLFLWNRDSHVAASWNSPYDKLVGPVRVPDARTTIEGASGILLECMQDKKKGKHLWKVLVTLRNGNCVIWTLNAKLFKRGWMTDIDDPVINWPKRL